MVRFKCISISSLVVRRVRSVLLVHNCTYNRLPEEELPGSKHVEDINKIKNSNIKLGKTHFDGLYCIINYITMHGAKKKHVIS